MIKRKMILGTSIGLLSLFSFSLIVEGESEEESTEETETDTNNTEASEKEELIYALLDTDGSVENIYVTNVFEGTTQREIVDYGQYEEIEVVNTSDELTYEEEEMRVSTEEERLITQGTLEDTPLPWEFTFTYTLDGEEIDPHEFEEESGELFVEMRIEPTDAEDEHLMEFADHFLLQVTTSMDHESHFDVESENGIQSTVGTQREIQWTVLPESEEPLSFQAETTDLELLEWEINAVPFSMDVDDDMLDTDEFMDELEELEQAIAEINQGASELNEGINQLFGGLQELEDGIMEMEEGLLELDAESDTLTEGSAQIREVLESINREIQAISLDAVDITSLLESSTVIQSGVEGISHTTEAIDHRVEQFYSHMDETGISSEGIVDRTHEAKENFENLEGRIEESIEVLIDEEVMSEEEAKDLLAGIQQTEAVLSTKEEWIRESQSVLSMVQAEVSSEGSLQSNANVLLEESVEIEDVIASLTDRISVVEESVEEMQAGVGQLVGEYAELDEGIQEYTQGVTQLLEGVQEASEGVSELSAGAQELQEGSTELAEGTSELREETTDLPGQVDEQVREFIDEFTNPDYEPSSFVDERNTIDTMQFVIELREDEATDNEPVEEEEDDRNIWERFLDLFR